MALYRLLSRRTPLQVCDSRDIACCYRAKARRSFDVGGGRRLGLLIGVVSHGTARGRRCEFEAGRPGPRCRWRRGSGSGAACRGRGRVAVVLAGGRFKCAAAWWWDRRHRRSHRCAAAGCSIEVGLDVPSFHGGCGTSASGSARAARRAGRGGVRDGAWIFGYRAPREGGAASSGGSLRLGEHRGSPARFSIPRASPLVLSPAVGVNFRPSVTPRPALRLSHRGDETHHDPSCLPMEGQTYRPGARARAVGCGRGAFSCWAAGKTGWHVSKRTPGLRRGSSAPRSAPRKSAL